MRRLPHSQLRVTAKHSCQDSRTDCGQLFENYSAAVLPASHRRASRYFDAGDQPLATNSCNTAAMPAVFSEASVRPGCSSPRSHVSHAAISFFKSGAGVSKLIASAYGALTATEDFLRVVRSQRNHNNRQANTKKCRARRLIDI